MALLLFGCGAGAPAVVDAVEPVGQVHLVSGSRAQCSWVYVEAFYFALGSSELQGELQPHAHTLAAIVERWRAGRVERVRVQGAVTSECAEEQDDAQLGLERAQAVAARLRELGLAADRLEVDPEISVNACSVPPGEHCAPGVFVPCRVVTAAVRTCE